MNMPVSFFSMAVGTLAWGQIWQAASLVWSLPAWLVDVASALGLLAWLLLLLAYVSKCWVHPKAVRAEFGHPVQSAMTALLPVSTLLAALTLRPWFSELAWGLWVLGVATQLVLGLCLAGRFWQGGRAAESVNATVYLPSVAQNFVAATACASFAWPTLAALFFGAGQMTMGALIACSILSGRILAPIMALPGLLVQHSHASAAMEGLERLYTLQSDNHGIAHPLVPTQMKGHYQLTHVQFSYGQNPPVIALPKLEIRPGERIAIVGPIGAGKSTLLRMLSGMYQPQKGSIHIDGLELGHISRQLLSQKIGYLQQDHRLFQGSLRENLLIGLPDPGDEVLFAAMTRTGMDRIVGSHPKGLERPIMEGGKGLSNGQKQLVAFTRLILCKPEILLLDEPNATMDDMQERQCMAVLAEEANAGKTMVIVTHKPGTLALVNRIIVVAGRAIVLDGPRDAVLQQLQQRSQPQAAS